MVPSENFGQGFYFPHETTALFSKVMSDTKSIRKREFRSDVPAALLDKASEFEKHVYNQLSIHRQQNEAILARLDEGDEQFKEDAKAREEIRTRVKNVSNRVEVFEKFKDRVTARWTVVAFIIGSILFPVAMALIGGFFVRYWEKIWK